MEAAAISGDASGISSARTALTKVPEITVYFWIVKILTTGMGETASDFMNLHMGPQFAVPLMLVLLYGALKLQFNAGKYVAWRYWFVVAMVSVFGTSAADALHEVGIPYLASTAVYLGVLGWIFRAWHKNEGTLSIHSVHTKKREQYYWATVFATFALGTAAGDLTAVTFHLGYLSSGIMFGVLILVPAIAHWGFRFGAIPAFWISYILTRPLGASLADWMAVPKNQGGLDFGTGIITLVLLITIVAFVGFLSVTKLDISNEVTYEEETRREFEIEAEPATSEA